MAKELNDILPKMNLKLSKCSCNFLGSGDTGYLFRVDDAWKVGPVYRALKIVVDEDNTFNLLHEQLNNDDMIGSLSHGIAEMPVYHSSYIFGAALFWLAFITLNRSARIYFAAKEFTSGSTLRQQMCGALKTVLSIVRRKSALCSSLSVFNCKRQKL